MRAICPITGIPFRTYDSLALHIAYPHPIFAMPFESLVVVLEQIRVQEEKEIEGWNADTQELKEEAKKMAALKFLTAETVEAIHEHNWNNTAFKLYQTKHLVMLAFAKHAELLQCEHGYAARPKPEIIEAHFWEACELFIWACTLRSPSLIQTLPIYKVSQINENMGNFKEYLEILDEVKTSIGERYRSISEENKLASWEQAIAILSRRRNVLKTKLATASNSLAAKWALTITRAPKDIWPFWYGILASSSTKITFEGVNIDGKWEAVNRGDLAELRDWLEDNLIGPKGEVSTGHKDDLEYYFVARQTVLDIVRSHISILEQGTSSYQIVNVAMGADILNASDDKLHEKAITAGLLGKPAWSDNLKKIEFIKAMAKWRHETKTALLEISNKLGQEISKQQTQASKGKSNYEIL